MDYYVIYIHQDRHANFLEVSIAIKSLQLKMYVTIVYEIVEPQQLDLVCCVPDGITCQVTLWQVYNDNVSFW